MSKRTIKFLDLSPRDDEMMFYIAILKSVLNSGKFILADHVKNFETEFAARICKKYCIGVGNGFDALQIILRTLNVKKGDGVVVPTNAPLPVWMAVSITGAMPIGMDIDPFTHTITPEILEKSPLLRSKNKTVKAIIIVHLYGLVADMDRINDLCEDWTVIEDCCQAHGASLRERPVGSMSAASAFSFYPTKNLGAFGDGGAIVTDDDKIAELAYEIREYGKGKRVGINSRLDELQAAFLSWRLLELDIENKGRQTKAGIYLEKLGTIKEINLPVTIFDSRPVWHQFVIQTDKRDELKSYLLENGIETMIHYDPPVYRAPFYNGVVYRNAEQMAKRVLSLPIGKGVTPDDVRYVCEQIKEFFDG